MCEVFEDVEVADQDNGLQSDFSLRELSRSEHECQNHRGFSCQNSNNNLFLVKK